MKISSIDEERLLTSMAKFVPRYLPAHPIDPFDDGPMRFLDTKVGLAIDSIGGDRKDVGGQEFGWFN